MSLEVQEGVVDRLTEKGVVLGGTWFGFSKHLKGPQLTETHLGHKVTVLFHTYMERPYIDVVKAIGEKVPGCVDLLVVLGSFRVQGAEVQAGLVFGALIRDQLLVACEILPRTIDVPHGFVEQREPPPGQR